MFDLKEVSDNQLAKEYESRFKLPPEEQILSAHQAARHFVLVLGKYHAQEVFAVMYLNAQNKHLSTENLFFGTLSEAVVYPREIIRKALSSGAASIILAHNHPSGDLNPSPMDIKITKSIAKICTIVGIKVLDHLIIARSNWLSFHERGLL